MRDLQRLGMFLVVTGVAFIGRNQFPAFSHSIGYAQGVLTAVILLWNYFVWSQPK